jgi:hypothetical protein
MIELIALLFSVSSIAFVIFIVLVMLVMLVMIVRRTGRRPQARGLFTRRCPNCRDIISDRATICPNCHGATGFGRSTVGDAQQRQQRLEKQKKRLENVKFLWFVIVGFVMLLVAVVAMLQASTKGRADPLPYKKVGQCAAGYRESGGFCTPMSERVPAAIPKTGQCPSGFMQSGAYCVEMRARR